MIEGAGQYVFMRAPGSTNHQAVIRPLDSVADQERFARLVADG